MEAIYLAVALFGITGIMGIYLSRLVLRGNPSSKPVIIIHGFFTIIGFGILFSYLPESLNSMLVLAVATSCGLVLLYQDISGKKFTFWLCYAHGIITITGFVFLLSIALEK